MSCYQFLSQESMRYLILIDLRSLKKLREISGASKVYKYGPHYGMWDAEFCLGQQGSWKTDSLIINIADPYGYYN